MNLRYLLLISQVDYKAHMYVIRFRDSNQMSVLMYGPFSTSEN